MNRCSDFSRWKVTSSVLAAMLLVQSPSGGQSKIELRPHFLPLAVSWSPGEGLSVSAVGKVRLPTPIGGIDISLSTALIRERHKGRLLIIRSPGDVKTFRLDDRTELLFSHHVTNAELKIRTEERTVIIEITPSKLVAWVQTCNDCLRPIIATDGKNCGAETHEILCDHSRDGAEVWVVSNESKAKMSS